jgi:dCMP deaminase
MSTKLRNVLERNAIRMGILNVKELKYVPTKWDIRFMEFTDLTVAQWSKDRSSRVGATIVKDREIVTTGFNGLPRGCDDNVEARHERPEKYSWFIHAEPNAIINAARQGKSTLGCDMYVNWCPCDQCSGFIVQAGIKRIFCDQEPDWDDPKWGEGFKRAKIILEEGGVEVIYMNYNAHRQGNI